MLLECVQVSKRFGGVQALKKVNITARKGEITGLVGPNGSGKTTLLSCINGAYTIDSGQILFEGENIAKLPTYQIVSKGIAKTSQLVQSFPDLSALENVLAAVHFGRGIRRVGKDPLERASQLLEFVGVPKEKFERPVKNCNITELRRIQLARALATDPKLLLLDELLTGLNPAECEKAINLVKKVKEQDIAILMVEHVMRIIMGLCDRVSVLHHGELIAEGTPGEIVDNEAVVRVYLGKKYLLRE